MRKAGKWNQSLVISSLRLDANNGGEPGDVWFDFIRFRKELVHVTFEGGVAEIQGIGNTLQLFAEVVIDTEYPVVLEWSADASGVVSVDETGLVTALNEGEAVVTAADAGGRGIKGEVTITVIVDHTMVRDSEAGILRFWPNPAGDLLYLENPGYIRSAAIFSAAGQQVRRIEVRPGITALDITALPAGVYVIRTMDREEGTGYCRFVKK
jgi:hypothetical protein